jgi:hypothetical protein
MNKIETPIADSSTRPLTEPVEPDRAVRVNRPVRMTAVEARDLRQIHGEETRLMNLQRQVAYEKEQLKALRDEGTRIITAANCTAADIIASAEEVRTAAGAEMSDALKYSRERIAEADGIFDLKLAEAKLKIKQHVKREVVAL